MQRSKYWLTKASVFLAGLRFLVIPIAISMLTTGKSDKLTCKRLERKYVNCQYERVNYYGLWSEPTLSFRVTGAEVENYVYRDSEDDTHDGYKMYLKAGNERIDFHEYKSHAEEAFAEQVRILELIAGIGEPSVHLDKSRE